MEYYDDIGKPNTEPHYPVGWAWAGNTPFPWVKQVASHLGGTRNPMVVSWPAKIKHDDKVRDIYTHLIDVVPTILEAASIPMPTKVDGIEQKPLAGKSFMASFTDPNAQGRDSQYYEVFTNRAMYSDGWLASAQHTLPWRQDLAPGNWENDTWELYNLNEDFSQAVNLADANPEKLKEMKAKFDQAAETFSIYPFDDRGAGRLAIQKPTPPGSLADATEFTFYAGATRLSETAAPNIKNRSWSLTADLETNGDDTSGAIMAFGGISSGVVVYALDGKLVFDYNYFDEHTVVTSDTMLPDGPALVEVLFDYHGGGQGKGGDVTLKLNDKVVGKGTVEATVAGRFGIDSFGIGEDSGQPVSSAYIPPFRFNSTLNSVTIKLK